jgi:STAG domain
MATNTYSLLRLVETMQPWIVARSSLPSRALRHTSTVIVLHIGVLLCPFARTSGADTAARSAGSVRTFLIESVYGSIFMNRYRDYAPIIRGACIEKLCDLVCNAPEIFWTPIYVRNFGWMLHDPEVSVRIEAAAALDKIYAVDSFASGMTLFTRRFKWRIVEMARLERDARLQASSARILTLLHPIKLLFDTEFTLLKFATLILEIGALQLPTPNPKQTRKLCALLTNVLAIESVKYDWILFAKLTVAVLNEVYGEDSVSTCDASTAIENFVTVTKTLPIYDTREDLISHLLVLHKSTAGNHVKNNTNNDTTTTVLVQTLAALAKTSSESV